VETKYERKLETLDELLASDLFYGNHPVVTFAPDTVSYPDSVKFLEHKSLQEGCSDLRKCVERMITERDFASTFAPFLATYVDRDLGTVDFGKIICSLDEVGMSAVATVLFKKGILFIDRFKVLMRRYLVAGLLEKL
jgi:hypothetical protein